MAQRLTFELEYGYVDSYSWIDSEGEEQWDDRPCCKTKNADTDIYSNFYEITGNKFKCRACSSTFEIVDDTDCACDERLVEILEDLSNEED